MGVSAIHGKGVTALHDLQGTAIGKATLEYRGKALPPELSKFEIECEVYLVDGIYSVHTVCPKCRHVLWIDGRKKDVEYDKATGKLYVAPFRCTWEMGEERRQYGFGMCRLRLAYDGKIAKDA